MTREWSTKLTSLHDRLSKFLEGYAAAFKSGENNVKYVNLSNYSGIAILFQVPHFVLVQS